MLRDFQVGIQALVLQHCLKRDREGIGVYGKVSPQKETTGRGWSIRGWILPQTQRPSSQTRFEKLREGCDAGNPWLASGGLVLVPVLPYTGCVALGKSFPLCAPQFPHWFSDRYGLKTTYASLV